jgi:hypothetical protein
LPIEKPIDVEKLERDERTERFREVLEGADSEETSEGAFTPSFPASGEKGWGAPE